MQKETIINIACADWLRVFKNKTKRILYCHVPNGGKRNKREAGLLKRMGVIAGIPDLIIFTAVSILLIELKGEDTAVSEVQKAVKSDFDLLGYQVHTIRTNDPVEAVRRLSELVLGNI